MTVYNAVFRIDQTRGGLSVGNPGISRRDLWLNHPIHLVPSSPPPSATFLWELLDKPKLSAAVLLDEVTGTPSTSSPLVKFVPDVWGTYRVRLTVNDRFTSSLLAAVILDATGAPTNRGWRLPAFNENSTESNFEGQSRGYADDFDFMMHDILENAFSGGGGGVVFGGDLTGNALTQTVVGVRGIPVLPAPLPANFQALLYQDGNLALTSLTQDMIAPAFSVSMQLNSGSLIEVGQTLTFPNFTASYSQPAPYNSVILTDTDGTPPKDVTSTPTAFSSNGAFQRLVYGGAVSFTLTANKGGIVRTASAQKTWVQKAYWFVSTIPGAYDQAWVESNSAGTLATTRNRSFSVNAGAGEYVYYIYRDGYGAGRFWVGGFEGGFVLEATIPMTRNGVTENYRVYRSINPSLGALTVTVTD